MRRTNLIKTLLCLAACYLLLGQPTIAQDARQFMELFGGMMQSAMREAVVAEWRKLSPYELRCIDDGLRQRRESVDGLIQRGVNPSDPAIFAVRSQCRSVAARTLSERSLAELSARPTFDCAKARSGVARILCIDRQTAKADWELSAVYWPYLASISENERSAFEQDQKTWLTSVNQNCGLVSVSASIAPKQIRCVLDAYTRRAQQLRSRLRGDALAESRLAPEQRARIQGTLITHGFLDGDADGEFGPKTRAAIRSYQGSSGFQQSDFLTAAQRAALLDNIATAQTSPPQSRPPESSSGGAFQPEPRVRAGPQSRPQTSDQHPWPSSPLEGEGVFTFQQSPPPNQRSAPAQRDRGPADGVPVTGVVRNTGAETITVTVTGTGASVDEARTDAIRQALQQTMKQLVIADRVISGDSILRDKILSTMNGYVDKFEQKRLFRTEQGVGMEADITVSASRIANFMGYSGGASASVRGADLAADISREVAQRTARGEIFDRSLRGFPSGALDLRILSIKPSEDSPTRLRIEIEVSFKRIFQQALENTVKALGGTECDTFQKSDFYHTFLDEVLRRRCAPSTRGKRSERNVVCLGYSAFVRCFLLPPSQYCSSCPFIGEDSTDLVLFYRLTDASGEALNESGCGISPGQPAHLATMQRYVGSKSIFAVFVFERKRWTTEIDTGGADISRFAQFVAVPALKDRRDGRVIADVTSKQSGCDLLEEATQRWLMITRSGGRQ